MNNSSSSNEWRTNQRYRMLVEHLREGIAIVDCAETVTFANPAACNIFGMEPGKLVGCNLRDFSDEQTWQQILIQARLRSEGEDTAYEVTIRRPDGEARILSVSATPEYNEDNGFIGSFGLIQDITEARQMEIALENSKRDLEKRVIERTAELKESEERFRILLDDVPSVAVQGYSSDGKIHYWNNASETIYGFSKEEAIGKVIFDLIIPPKMREEVCEAIKLGAETGEMPPPGELSLMRKDGSEVSVLSSHAVVKRPWSEPEFFCFDVDITAGKLAEEARLSLERQVLQAQKIESLGVMAGGIAHDFNNLLMVIMGNANLALDHITTLSPARSNIDEIEHASKRAAALARQMLSYSGKGKLSNDSIELTKFIEDKTHLLEAGVSRNVVLKYCLADNIPPVKGDPTQIRQIILHLIGNASEAYGNQNGVVTVSTGAMECTKEYLESTGVLTGAERDESFVKGNYVFLEVTDEGCGMDEATLEKIFDPFYTTKFTGRGLGLAATLGIVRGHNGAIQVDSEPGSGTTFKVLIPACEVSEAKPIQSSPEQENNWQGEGLVLLADDDESILTVGKRMLMRKGFDVLTARDGIEALNLFSKNKDEIVCVLLDLSMPNLDGERTCLEMQALRPDVKVLLCSGFDEEDVRQQVSCKDLTGFIQKPFSLKELSSKLQSALDN